MSNKAARSVTFDVLRKGRVFESWTTTTHDIDEAKAEAIEALGLPPDVVLKKQPKESK